MFEYKDGVEWLAVLLFASTLAIGIAFFVTQFMKRASAATRYSIWQSALCGLLVLPLVVAVLPTIPLGMQLAGGKDIGVSGQPDSRELSMDGERNPIAQSAVAAPKTNQLSGETQLPVEKQMVGLSKQLPTTTSTASTALNEVTEVAYVKVNSVNWMAVLFWVWLVGLAIHLLRMGMALLRIRHIVRNSISIDTIEIYKRTQLDPESELIGVTFALSEKVEVPITTGIFAAKILLPESAIQRSNADLRMILRHELAHVRRRDVLWQVAIALVNSIYWFQPMAWLANRFVAREREQACDDLVIGQGESQFEYASVLLDFASSLSSRQIAWVGAVPMAQKPLEYRLKAILDESVSRKPFNRVVQKCVLIGAMGLVFCLGVIRPFQPVASGALVGNSSSRSQDSRDKNKRANSHVQLPDVLKGVITDDADKPLMNAKISVEYCTWKDDESTGVSIKTVHRQWNVESSATGEYSIDTSGLDASGIDPKTSKINFLGAVAAKGHVTQTLFVTGRYVLKN